MTLLQNPVFYGPIPFPTYASLFCQISGCFVKLLTNKTGPEQSDQNQCCFLRYNNLTIKSKYSMHNSFLHVRGSTTDIIFFLNKTYVVTPY